MKRGKKRWVKVNPNVADVYTRPMAFSPYTTTIRIGGVVRFNIFGISHNVIFDETMPGRPADILETLGVVVERTFPVAGTFRYACTVHPGMDGEVVVK